MFDEPTRRASQGNLQGFGDALAGRGADLNQTIQAAPAALRPPRPVMANLSAPRTELPRFFKELGDAARIVAPVSKTNAHLFTDDGQHLRGVLARPAGAEGHDRQEPADAATSATAVAARAAPVPRAHRGVRRATSTPPPTELRGALPTVNRALRDRHAGARGARSQLNDDLQGALGALRGPRQGADDASARCAA